MADPVARPVDASRVAFMAYLLLLAACGGDPAAPAFDPLSVTSTALPDGVENVDYGLVALAATGGDGSYSWVLASGSGPLPMGLSLAATGSIMGIPTAAGVSSFTVEVASGDGQTAQRALSIAVSAPPVLLPSELCGTNPGYAIATFEDAALEALVRASLSVDAQDDLTCGLLSGLTQLVAVNLGITSVVGMQNLTALALLDLNLNLISDVSALSGLTTLTTLDLSENTIGDVGALSGLTSLTALELSDNTSVSDIGSLSALTSLSVLGLDRNSVGDISALAALAGVENLSLEENAITDLSALSGLTNLTALDLRGNAGVTDIQPLIDNSGLGTGDVVDLGGTGVSCGPAAVLWKRGVAVTVSGCVFLQPGERCDGQPGTAIATFEDAGLETEVRTALGIGAQDELTCGLVAGLTSLTTGGVGITSLVGIQNLTSLTYLDLARNTIVDLGSLTGLTDLTDLILAKNSISDVNAIASLTNLTTLDLGDNIVGDVGALSALTNLTTLRLDVNAVGDVSALSGMTGLGVLDLFQNSITDVSPLSGLVGLTELDLGRNSIGSASPLSGLTLLTWLDLSENAITDVTPLAGLTSLDVLSLRQNTVSDISSLSGLTSLTAMNLDDNTIADIGALSGMTALEGLSLANNSITDITALSGLTGLSLLWLNENTALSVIQPLLDNTGIGPGDIIDLRSTSVSCSDVTLLGMKGAAVGSDCP